MIADETLRDVVMRANLAPSVHNIQPARWRREGDDILVAADLAATLPVGDPDNLDAGLSCGAAVEATVLALGQAGFAADVTDCWTDDDTTTWPGTRIAARLRLSDGDADPLAQRLEDRFTWRGLFADETPKLFGWSRPDTVLVLDQPSRNHLAARNDWASLQIMRDRAFRRELLHWMRLTPRHPRFCYDGLNRDALRMEPATARAARWALGPFWRVLDMVGATKGLTAEAEATRSAPVIACFHRPRDESPVATGRAYLRLCLEAANLGFAGWPMAALSDHPQTRAEICDQYAIGPDRRLVQVIRFGVATGDAPARARRPLSEILS
ncbi:hypothetical protein [Yoonia sp. 208BN28-4]|uniref:hypothetical protein n=1 Tax=Yoonia sp. 208BN28-4 TaxID=3126505 RepID=UPI00309B9ED1